MPTKSRSSKSAAAKRKSSKTATGAKTAAQRMAERRKRLRAQGLRPVQFWVPDLRDPKVLADLRRQAKLIAAHPEDEEINDWIESVYDWDSWK